MVLGLLGDASAVNVLRGMRVDIEPAVRQQAAEALWRLGDEQGMADLIGLSVSRYPDDEMIGLLGLAQPHDVRIRQHVRGGLVSDWPEVNLVAARAMGILGSDEGYGIVLQGAKSADPTDRLLATLAFGAIGRSDSQDLLRELLKDSESSIRIAAATSILQLKPPR